MKLSLMKADGYEGLLVDCRACRKLVEIPFDKLPDGEFVEVAAKLICSVCKKRPNVTTYRSHTAGMVIGGIKR